MPRIRSPTQIKDGRAFALYTQLSPRPDGSVPKEALDQLVAKYGKGSAPGGEELSFEDFAALFKQPSTQATEGEGDCIGWAAFDAKSPLRPWRFTRRATRPNDVRIQITHAGICHSDIHQVKNEWGNSTYPMVPGHEIVGIVTEVGSDVTKHKVGDRVGVGCMVNSCQNCDACLVLKDEQFCPKQVGTYNSKDVDGSPTYGGYSTHVLVDEKFVLRVPDSIPLERAAPLLCAGITTYSPIKHYGFDKPGQSIGVVGLGGLGHMAVQFLKAMGVHTTVISTSPRKKEEALKVLKADNFIVSKDEQQMKAAAGTLDGILDCVSAKHDIGALMGLMKADKTIVLVGLPPVDQPNILPGLQCIFRRQRVGGSIIGGIRETQEMLDFCAETGVHCLSEIVQADYMNEAYERVIKGDVRYRFVIDIQGSLIA